MNNVIKESKNDYQFIFQIKSEDIEFAIDWTMQANGSVKEGSLSFSYDDGTNKISSKICDLKIESLTKATDDLIEVNKDNSLILNTATEDDIEDFANDVTSNVQGIMTKISSSLDY